MFLTITSKSKTDFQNKIGLSKQEPELFLLFPELQQKKKSFTKCLTRLHIDFIQTSFNLHLNFIQTSSRLLLDFSQTSPKLNLDFIQTSPQLQLLAKPELGKTPKNFSFKMFLTITSKSKTDFQNKMGLSKQETELFLLFPELQ